jgi:hypothetical protein
MAANKGTSEMSIRRQAPVYGKVKDGKEGYAGRMRRKCGIVGWMGGWGKSLSIYEMCVSQVQVSAEGSTWRRKIQARGHVW